MLLQGAIAALGKVGLMLNVSKGNLAAVLSRAASSSVGRRGIPRAGRRRAAIDRAREGVAVRPAQGLGPRFCLRGRDRPAARGLLATIVPARLHQARRHRRRRRLCRRASPAVRSPRGGLASRWSSASSSAASAPTWRAYTVRPRRCCVPGSSRPRSIACPESRTDQQATR